MRLEKADLYGLIKNLGNQGKKTKAVWKALGLAPMCVFKSDLDQIGNLIEIDVCLAANVLPRLAVGWFFLERLAQNFSDNWW
jgi:hypothetical protein